MVSSNEDIVREYVTMYGPYPVGEHQRIVNEALDALVAERDEARRLEFVRLGEAQQANELRLAAEAARDEALKRIALETQGMRDALNLRDTKLEAAEDELAKYGDMDDHYLRLQNECEEALQRAEAAERVKDAAQWLVDNRGHRGETQAWRLLEKALTDG